MGKSMTRTDLSESAQTLLAVTRDAYEPSASNRAHVRWRVDRVLAAEGGLVAPRRVSRVVRVATLAAAAVVVVGAAAALTWRGVHSESPPANVVTPVDGVTAATDTPRGAAARPAAAAQPTEQPDEARPEARATSSLRSARRSKSGARAEHSRRGDLSGEVALIARAQSATNRGDAEKALTALREYDRKHPGGELAEERSAARILALCAAGRRKEARAAAARFLAKWPHSPQAARIHSSCAR
jgi:hypothetical protein